MERPTEAAVVAAVDTLARMAELDMIGPELTRAGGYVSVEGFQPPEAEKHDLVPDIERLRATFRTLHLYLRDLFEKDQGQLFEPQMQRGVQALMHLASEAIHKVDQFSSLFKEEGGIRSAKELKEYRELQQFYMTKLSKKFQNVLELEEFWEEGWSGDVEGKQQGIRDLIEVKRDRDYELFFIRRENGKPYFHKQLLHHLCLVGEFDEILGKLTTDDPRLKIEQINDRDVHASAREILHYAAPYVDAFYREAMSMKEKPLVAALNKALMALMLAANPQNLMKNTSVKNALHYYEDFHDYLRQAIATPEYVRMIAHPPAATDPFGQTQLNLIHALCISFFMRTSVRKEAILMIHRLMQADKSPEPASFWNQLLLGDHDFREALAKLPNGPVLKTLTAFREEEFRVGFDPIAQQNLPEQLYTLQKDGRHVTCLKLPAPVCQEFIHQARVVDEFEGFIRALKSEIKVQRHLLINLQDRTSWQEHSRSVALEKLTHPETLWVVTLAKNTDFYHQSGEYQELNEAHLFMEQLQEQVMSGEGCGFHFPSEIDDEKLLGFIDETLPMIHKVVFGSKDLLLRKNRLDFIEIFYLFLTQKLIEWSNCDSFSFTCKDALDTGAAMSASFYVFSLDRPLNEEEKEFILWLLYRPSLFVRERAIDPFRLHRAVSALSVLESVKSEIIGDHRKGRVLTPHFP